MRTQKLCAALLLLVAPLLPGGAAGEERRSSSILSEIKIGLLEHDIGFLGANLEPGRDVNAELLFASPDLLEPIFAPRPHFGVSVNTDGAAGQLYAGLTWTIRPIEEGVLGRFWLSPFLGGMVHNGEISSLAEDEKSLGSRVLFRFGAELGVDLTDRLNLSIVYEHASNANLADENEGLNSAGVRVGWRL